MTHSHLAYDAFDLPQYRSQFLSSAGFSEGLETTERPHKGTTFEGTPLLEAM